MEIWGYLHLFFLTIMNNGMMNIDVECLSPCFWLFSFSSRSRITGSCGNSVLNFLRNFCTFFSHRLQPVMHKHSSSPLLDNTCYFVGFLFFGFFFGDRNLNGCEVVSYYGFDLWWCLASFPVHIDHLGVFFGEIPI